MKFEKVAQKTLIGKASERSRNAATKALEAEPIRPLVRGILGKSENRLIAFCIAGNGGSRRWAGTIGEKLRANDKARRKFNCHRFLFFPLVVKLVYRNGVTQFEVTSVAARHSLPLEGTVWRTGQIA